MMVVSPLFVLLIWQLLVNVGVISLNSFTSPIQVMYALIEIITESNPGASRQSRHAHLGQSSRGRTRVHWRCMRRCTARASDGWSQIVRNILDPIVELLRPIPPTAWVAISLLLLGLGLQQKVFVVFVGTVESDPHYHA